MFVKSIKLASKAIFPIFIWQQTGLQTGVGVAGTGFFINSSGYFVTAAHVFDGKNQNTQYKYWGRLPEEVINPPIDIIEVARDDNKDIFIGKIPNVNTNRFLKLANWLPKTGKSVCISGYPLATITHDPATGFQLGMVRRYFQPSFVLDSPIIGNSITNGKTRIHDGFLVRDVGLFGMSGGPIFDINGYVLGMQGSVITRTSTNGQQNIDIHNALAVKSQIILDVLNSNNIKYSI